MKVNVQIEGQTYTVEVGDLRARPIQAVVDGEQFAVWPEEIASAGAPAPAPVAQLVTGGAAPPAPASESRSLGGDALVRAPLPGDIVAVLVNPGDPVAVGQEMVTLESMKMRNAVRSTRTGTIKTVLVSAGDRVTHGQPMIEFTA